MSTATSSSKNTTANNILYKKAKDDQQLPSIPASDVQRTVRGSRRYPNLQRGGTRGCTRIGQDIKKESGRSWLTRKEAQEEEKRKSEAEKKKKKNKPVAPVVSGSGSKKGKGKEIEIIGSDSDSETNTEFQESCIGCEHAKVRCIFTDAINGKKVACDHMDVNSEVRNRLQAESFYHQYNLQVISGLQWSLSALANIDGQNIGLRTLDNQLPSDTSVPEDLQDTVVHGRDHVIEHYNNIAEMCGAQMKSISSRYGLGKNFGARVPLLNCYGELDLTGEVESGIKKRKAEEAVVEPSPSKRIRKDKEPESEEKRRKQKLKREWGPIPHPWWIRVKGRKMNQGLRRMGKIQ
ncbi:hypothetical protein M422DRAFT_258026 [Sphaerobolus stellatus SS14]|uniref:Uncharacterized protein n=1 Tax=Sphaerobolus stellatus (strain SS14) TaxID=990650 RepID=A0A0C9VMH2_SPHS4|nr:hypothetical protein M422DRAFT_258026 [Sphaerobolus stellatus SS14]